MVSEIHDHRIPVSDHRITLRLFLTIGSAEPGPMVAPNISADCSNFTLCWCNLCVFGEIDILARFPCSWPE